MTNKTIVKVGKYEISHTNGTDFVALRHGEPWRNLNGDNLVLALVDRIDQLQKLWLEPNPEMVQAGLAEVQTVLDTWEDEGYFRHGTSEEVTDDMASDLAVFVSQAMAGKLPKDIE